MPKVDWSGYAREQFHWAERLVAAADEADGDAARSLRRKAEATLIDAGGKLGIALVAAPPEDPR